MINRIWIIIDIILHGSELFRQRHNDRGLTYNKLQFKYTTTTYVEQYKVYTL